ncbi:MAG: hypothetical protein WD883_00675 [Candidatus Colwellbacteria bacterium]
MKSVFNVSAAIFLASLSMGGTLAQELPSIIGTTLISKIAPGELMPITVKLVNFGTSERVDVQIFYQMQDQDGRAIVTEHETVAVHTSAIFSKVIQIPFQTMSGQYTITASAYYPDQTTLANSSLSIDVERKLFGLFISELKEYSWYMGIAMLSIVALIYILFRRTAQSKAQGEYRFVGRRLRLFYQILDDMVSQATKEIGDHAVFIANRIDGLKVSKKGRVVSIDGDPARIISELASLYEKELGIKVRKFPIRD